jgi:hypothetical protein
MSKLFSDSRKKHLLITVFNEFSSSEEIERFFRKIARANSFEQEIEDIFF